MIPPPPPPPPPRITRLHSTSTSPTTSLLPEMPEPQSIDDFSDSDTSTIRPPIFHSSLSEGSSSIIRPSPTRRTSPKLPPPSLANPSLMQQRFTRLPKPLPFGTAGIPLAQQLGLTTPTTNDGHPILPSALPTRHVSHGVTNLYDRGTRTPSASGTRIFSRDVQPVAQTMSLSGAQASSLMVVQGSQPVVQPVAGVAETPQPPTSHRIDLTPPPSGTAITHIWTSSNQALRDDFKYVKSKAHHLGLDESPAFPETAAQFARVRADQKNRAADMLRREVRQREKWRAGEEGEKNGEGLLALGRKEKEVLEEANRKPNGWASRAIDLFRKDVSGKAEK